MVVGVTRRANSWRTLQAALVASTLALLSGCASWHGSGKAAGGPGRTTTPSVAAPLPPQPTQGAAGTLPGPRSRNWEQFKLLAAQQIVAGNAGQTYAGVPPDVLLAVPVLQIEFNADGSVAHIDVLRRPHQAADTVDIAIGAVRRAAPYGDVSHLPRPWKFTESFLFNGARKFKPRTLDR